MLPQSIFFSFCWRLGEWSGTSFWASLGSLSYSFVHAQFSTCGFSMFGQWMVKSKEQDNYINLILQMKKQGVSFKILPLQVIEDPTKSGLKLKKKLPHIINLKAEWSHDWLIYRHNSVIKDLDIFSLCLSPLVIARGLCIHYVLLHNKPPQNLLT